MARSANQLGFRHCIPHWGCCSDGPQSVSGKGARRSPPGQWAVTVFCLCSSAQLQRPVQATPCDHLGCLLPNNLWFYPLPVIAAPKLPVLSLLNRFSVKSLYLTLQAPVLFLGSFVPPPNSFPTHLSHTFGLCSQPPFPHLGAVDLLLVSSLRDSLLSNQGTPPSSISLALISKVTQRLCLSLLPLLASHFLAVPAGRMKVGLGSALRNGAFSLLPGPFTADLPLCLSSSFPLPSNCSFPSCFSPSYSFLSLFVSLLFPPPLCFSIFFSLSVTFHLCLSISLWVTIFLSLFSLLSYCF